MKALPSLITLIILTLPPACRTSQQATQTPQSSMNNKYATTGPPATIYKTVANYNNNVPIIMNDQRTAIISYPAPTDLSPNSKPTPLRNGYLLDNRGINQNVVFLRYTYDQYQQLPQAPTIAELQANIIDKYPLIQIIQCGYRHQYKNLIKAMNQHIKTNFINCKSHSPTNK